MNKRLYIEKISSHAYQNGHRRVRDVPKLDQYLSAYVESISPIPPTPSREGLEYWPKLRLVLSGLTLTATGPFLSILIGSYFFRANSDEILPYAVAWPAAWIGLEILNKILSSGKRAEIKSYNDIYNRNFYFRSSLEKDIQSALDVLWAENERQNPEAPMESTLSKAETQTSAAPGTAKPATTSKPPKLETCNPREAEYWIRKWLVFFGERDARVTQATRDDGIDIESSNYVVEVKHHQKPIGPIPVRAILGVAISKKKQPLIFSQAGFTTAAVNFGEANGIAMYSYETQLGQIYPITSTARKILYPKSMT